MQNSSYSGNLPGEPGKDLRVFFGLFRENDGRNLCGWRFSPDRFMIVCCMYKQYQDIQRAAQEWGGL